ncbi:MAG: sugar nucleotide-binding protein, partial [Micropruina sp.]|nr:sugar nucleotide-binding protein [Micropruina sp.]
MPAGNKCPASDSTSNTSRCGLDSPCTTQQFQPAAGQSRGHADRLFSRLLGHALQRVLPEADALGIEALDLTDADAVAGYPWQGVGTVINAAAWTAVDDAETPDGRRGAWAVNVGAVANLVAAAREHRFTLVHVSSDYVFDGREV